MKELKKYGMSMSFGSISMKKLLTLLLLSLGFISSVDAITRCPDGSYVSGSNCQRAPNGTYLSGGSYGNSYYSGRGGVGAAANYNAGALVGNVINSLFNSTDSSSNTNSNNYRYSNKYGAMTGSTYLQGYMEGAATGVVVNLNSLFDSSSDKWKCPSGYKRDFADGCVKIFVADFNDGADAYQKGDYKTAIKHWELLAKAGNASAQYILGKMYENGVGFKKSDYWAFHWLKKAAELGHTDAQYTLGYMYRNGAGIVKNSEQTVKWFNKAGNKGHTKAQFNLGAMYINGDTVKKSLKDAKYWIQLAKKNGYGRAEEIWNEYELWKY